jgi:hypothetical protein
MPINLFIFHRSQIIQLRKQPLNKTLYFHSATTPRGLGPPHYWGFTITLRHTAVGGTPLDEWLACRRDLYLTTHNTHNRQTSMPPSGILPHNPSKRAAADLSLIPRGHWDRQIKHFCSLQIHNPLLPNQCTCTKLQSFVCELLFVATR